MKKEEKDKKATIENETDQTKTTKSTGDLEQKVEELTLGWQRCQADFTNYRRQAEEDKKRLIKTANADLMMEIVPVLDNFQLAAKHMPAELETNNWASGIRQIEKQLEDILSNEGLKKIVTVGAQFDPYLHEAVEQTSSDKPEGEIIEEISVGYEFDGKVLRPARVKVSSGK
jgi:molecular chaperone GrpE